LEHFVVTSFLNFLLSKSFVSSNEEFKERTLEDGVSSGKTSRYSVIDDCFEV